MNVILYGLCKTTEFVEKALLPNHTIIGYMDSFSCISVYKGKPFYRREQIQEVLFDVLVIAIGSRKSAWNVRSELINCFGIPEEKIIPYFVYAEYHMADIELCREKRKIEGLIFGNSHAFYGYLPCFFSKNFLNLALPAQDIVGCYQAFQRCIERYGDKLNKLKYIVIDMYDYNVFNVDVSQGVHFMEYIECGGEQKERNWSFNELHKAGAVFENEVFEHLNIVVHDEKILLKMQELFYHGGLNLPLTVRRRVYERREHIEPNAPLMTRNVLAKAVHVRRESTIQENLDVMMCFLESIKKFNPNIKIVMTLIPRYQTMEQALAPVIRGWEEEFKWQVKNYIHAYDVAFWNYKKTESFSSNHRFYYDVCHLNTVGAECISSKLEDDMRKYLY